jgi:hypothetical protein
MNAMKEARSRLLAVASEYEVEKSGIPSDPWDFCRECVFTPSSLQIQEARTLTGVKIEWVTVKA